MCAVLGLFCEFFLAFRAGDGDFAFATGNPHRLTASGAAVIAMLLVPPLLQQHQKPSIFPVSLVGISGQTPEQHPAHQKIGNHRQHQPQQPEGQKHLHHNDPHTAPKKGTIQLVDAVTSFHKTGEKFPNPPHHITFSMCSDTIIFNFRQMATLSFQC